MTLAWEAGRSHRDVTVQGFQVLVDGKPLGPPLAPSITQSTIDNLQAGHTITVTVVTVTDHPIGNSPPSNAIKVTAPHKPPAPHLTEQPSYKKGAVIVAWDKPEGTEHMPYGEDIVSYRSVQGESHGLAQVKT